MTSSSATSARLTGSALRSLTTRFAGRALGRTLRLPAPTTGYTVSRVAIPMRDGVELVADHYVPAGDTEPVGTLLVRGPYGRGFPLSLLFGALYAARGYRVRAAERARDVRLGRRPSSRWFTKRPTAPTPSPGCGEQPWFTGRFATMGISYLGFTQWALLHGSAAGVGCGRHHRGPS